MVAATDAAPEGAATIRAVSTIAETDEAVDAILASMPKDAVIPADTDAADDSDASTATTWAIEADIVVTLDPEA